MKKNIDTKKPRRLRRVDFETARFVATVGPDSTMTLTRRRDETTRHHGTNRPLVALLFAFRNDADALDTVLAWLFQSKMGSARWPSCGHQLDRSLRPMTPPLDIKLPRQCEALAIYGELLKGSQVGQLIERRARALGRGARPDTVDRNMAWLRLRGHYPADFARARAA